MNQRESSGVPLRAIVMVLLFLGVVFLLVAFQAMGSDDDSDGAGAPVAGNLTTTTTTTATTPPPAEEPAPRPEVWVYNVSDVAGAAAATADRLREAEWPVADVGDMAIEGVEVTTVFFGDAPGEEEAAHDVGQLLEAPVEPRTPGLAEQPPGVIVAVTG
ncbi:LytR C-terminal domain-containing protein [Mycolicibacterium thermoresistibile]